jgi:hypothetical protein
VPLSLQPPEPAIQIPTLKPALLIDNNVPVW